MGAACAANAAQISHAVNILTRPMCQEVYPDCSRLCKDFDPQWLTPGFAQRVFTLILQRLENGDGTELMDLRDWLTDDEMGRLSGIIARGGESADAKQEFSDCLQTIRAEQQKKQESAAELDDQAFRDLFRHHS